MSELTKPRRLPYGMQNWEDVRLENYYYVDKTHFIPEIEAANNFFFFIRPRRFGKSLLLNMLRQYYDVKKAPLFERLFGDLWIGQHPTEMHNKYLVLYLNFAAFSGNLEGYKERMDDLTSGFNIGTNYTTQAQFNIFPDIEHSYVLELKYLPARATQTEVDAAAAQAREQLLRYAQSVAIERTYKPTQLHRLVLVWHGMELAVAEEL